MKKFLSTLSLALVPGIASAQHYMMYYGGDYGYANYGWHVPLFFLVFIPVIWFLFCLAVFVLWIWMLIDAIKYAPEKMKLVWVIVIIFTCIIGALIYYFVEHRPRIKAEKKEGK